MKAFDLNNLHNKEPGYSPTDQVPATQRPLFWLQIVPLMHDLIVLAPSSQSTYLSAREHDG